VTGPPEGRRKVDAFTLSSGEKGPTLKAWEERSLPTGTVSTYTASMSPIISIQNLSKTYASGLSALKNINLEINRGEIFALLGPNGAGKTTLISVICGIVNKSQGAVLVDGRDNVSDFRHTRTIIGLVPQELHLPIFETVWDTVNFSRALFGGGKNHSFIEKILRQLSLWEKKDAKIVTLSGGMKRRVLIAKALSHEPKILFLDEPTAGVDVELRKDMWALVRNLRESGVTIILTTHYIEEAEEMADRVGVINKGEMILIEDKSALMKKMGRKKLVLELVKPLAKIPKSLEKHKLALSQDGRVLTYEYDARAAKAGVTPILADLAAAKIVFGDLHTEQSSLEDIFIGLVKQ
jgi:ABC-2 type transport system ATP-binding protein